MPSVNKPIQNFGRNITLNPNVVYRPASEEELLQILRNSGDSQIRAVGKLHCWSEAIQADQILICTDRLTDISIHHDNDRTLVTVGSGCQVKALLNELADAGLTLPSIGLIDEQTIAGATATGTHGSGKHSLSHYVAAVRIAHFDESGQPTITMIGSGPELQAARCSLGLLGIVVSLTFECRSQYRIHEYAARYDSIQAVIAQESSYPLQQFYLMPWSWEIFAHHRTETDKPKTSSAGIYRIYCFWCIDVALHIAVYILSKLLPIAALTKFFYRRVLGLTIPRNWNVVDDARKMLVMEHELFRHIEIELFVTRSQLSEATRFLIDALSQFGGATDLVTGNSETAISPLLQGVYLHRYPICFRRVLPDDALISMSSPNHDEPGDDWYAISLISYQWPSRRAGFFKMASFMAHQMKERYGARCHWGKYNPLQLEDNEQLYPKLKQFNAIRKKFDPDNRFSNRWLDRVC